MVELKMRKVKDEEFDKSLSSLDAKGAYVLSVACGKERSIFYEKGKPVCYIISSDDYARVTGFTVHQDYRGKGYGRKIIEILKENAKKNNRELIVSDPTGAPDFFKNCGVKIEWPMFDDSL
jgi:GNAT superfamily N-acetyltransferase